MFKIMMTDTEFPDTLTEERILNKIDGVLVRPKDTGVSSLIETGRDCDAIMCDYAEISAEVISGLEKCKIIVVAGMGVDNIDLEAAAKKQIKVANIPSYCIGEVADHAMALFLACVKKIVRYDRDVKAGIWNSQTYTPIYRLAGMKFCCFGLGKISRKVAKRAQAFDMDVYSYDPYLPDSVFEEAGVTRVRSLEDLASIADVFSIHVPASAQTKGIINQSLFRLMKPTCIVLNVARGALVDTDDLAKALAEGQITAAGIDVQENEPPLPSRNPLAALENVVLTPHVAYMSVDAEQELRETMAEEIVRTLTEGRPLSWVNEKMFGEKS